MRQRRLRSPGVARPPLLCGLDDSGGRGVIDPDRSQREFDIDCARGDGDGSGRASPFRRMNKHHHIIIGTPSDSLDRHAGTIELIWNRSALGIEHANDTAISCAMKCAQHAIQIGAGDKCENRIWHEQ